MYILAIDLGTQSIRAAIVDINGNILSVSQESQEVSTPEPGWAQQKPKNWWIHTQKVIKDVLKKSKIDINLIKGICTCGQMHGPVGIDETGEIITEWTQIWMDKRSETICRMLRDKFNESELVANITANPITTGWSGIKVRWIKENQPEIYNKTKWFLVPKDFINFKLTGRVATDPSEASGTYLFDYKTEKYSPQMAEILELDLHKFAPIHKSYSVIGNVKENISTQLGIPRNTPVIAGGGDFIVSLLGLGLVDESTAVDMTGTSTLFVVHKEKPIINPLVQNLRHVIDGWLPFTMLDCGGLSIKWCKDLLESVRNNEVSYEEIIKMASEIPIGSEGLIFYPYMLGERRKDNSFARGCFFGLNLNHKIEHLARSVMEGTVLALGNDIQNFRNLGVNIHRVVCVGGATRNKLLYKMKADLTQLPHILINEPEASLRGGALLAAYGLGLIKDLSKAEKGTDLETKTIEPNISVTSQYNELLLEFKRIYDHMLGYWN